MTRQTFFRAMATIVLTLAAMAALTMTSCKKGGDDNGKPTVPGVVASFEVTSDAPGKVTLNWTAPSKEGGKAITKYRVWTSDEWIDVPSGTTYTIPGDVGGGGDVWTVKVRAVNEVGEGAEKTITFEAWQAGDPVVDTGGSILPVVAWGHDGVDYSGYTIKGTYALDGDEDNTTFEKVITLGTAMDGDHYIREGNDLKYDTSDYNDGMGWCEIDIRANGTTLTEDGELWMPSDYVFLFEY